MKYSFLQRLLLSEMMPYRSLSLLCCPEAQVKALHLFLLPCQAPSSEWLLNKSLNDLEKAFLGTGTLSYSRHKDAVRVTLRLSNTSSGSSLSSTTAVPQKDVLYRNSYLVRILSSLPSALTHCTTLELPLWVTPFRDTLLESLHGVSTRTGVRLIVTPPEKDTPPKVTLLGHISEVAHARIEVFTAVEGLKHTYSTYTVTDALSADLALVPYLVERSSNTYLFTGTRIGPGVCLLVSDASADTHSLSSTANLSSTTSLTNTTTQEETLMVDPVKLAYSLVYMREYIEEVLARTYTHIEIDSTRVSNTAEGPQVAATPVRVVGVSATGTVRQASAELAQMYTEIVLVRVPRLSQYHTGRLFVFSMGTDTSLDEQTQIVVGSSEEIKRVLYSADNLLSPCVVLLDMSLTAEDFVCGKKNGKINKIARETDCSISVNTQVGTHLVIQGPPIAATLALSLVEDELPAEYAFYLHEGHHKRIIGYAGKTIQRLMKKHGVYIKFDSSGSADSIPALSYITFPMSKSATPANVLIRTPRKNKESLYRMHKDVLRLAGEVPPVSISGEGLWSTLSYFDFYAVNSLLKEYSLGYSTVRVRHPGGVIRVRYYIVRGARICAQGVPGMQEYYIQEKDLLGYGSNIGSNIGSNSCIGVVPLLSNNPGAYLENSQYVCRLPEGEQDHIVASLSPVEGALPVTASLWGKESASAAISNYLAVRNDNEEILFSKGPNWRKKWRSSFMETWHRATWG